MNRIKLSNNGNAPITTVGELRDILQIFTDECPIDGINVYYHPLSDSLGDVAKLEIEVYEGFQNENIKPTKPGWYECIATDDRWDGETRYRAWDGVRWLIPLKDGWFSAFMGIYKWKGPVADVNGPAPDGTNPK